MSSSTIKFEELKYAELRKLAKEVGIKANMKSDKLIQALQKYYAENKPKTPLLKNATPKPSSSKKAAVSTTPLVSKTKQVPHRNSNSRPASEHDTASEKNTETHQDSNKQKTQTPSSTKRTEKSTSSDKPKRVRTSTYEKTPTSNTVVSSPVTSKPVVPVSEAPVPTTVTEPPTQIPRFAAFLAKKKKAGVSNVTKTPDWKKIHQRQFDKMDSIDTYLNRKRKRTDSLEASVKTAKLACEKAHAAVAVLNKLKTPAAEAQHTGVTKSRSKSQLFMSPAHSGVPFIPSITSARKINTNFGELKTPHNIEQEGKTSGRTFDLEKSTTKKTVQIVPSACKENKARKSVAVLNESRTAGITPGKKAFDLQASLSKPLSWKPHTGKLKPFKLGSGEPHRVDPKKPKLTTRDDRRQRQMSERLDKRMMMQMKRRGITGMSNVTVH